jgi:hypothetical protein
VSFERAETYLRRLAEGELRRVGDQLRGPPAAAGPDRTLGGIPVNPPFAASEVTQWRVIRAGRILVAAGALDQDFLDRLADDLSCAIQVRSRLLLDWDRRRGVRYRSSYVVPAWPAGPSLHSMRVTPLGRAIPVPGDDGPATLHLMSLVRAGGEAVITAALRQSRVPDQRVPNLPYQQLAAVDEHGARYAVWFLGDRGRPGIRPGLVQVSPAPPDGAGRLDLIGDGTCLVQLSLSAASVFFSGRHFSEACAVPAGERLLVLEAERILASGDAGDRRRARSRERSSRCWPRRARSPLTARGPASLPRCASGSARAGTASPSRLRRGSRRRGPASSRTGPGRHSGSPGGSGTAPGTGMWEPRVNRVISERGCRRSGCG